MAIGEVRLDMAALLWSETGNSNAVRGVKVKLSGSGRNPPERGRQQLAGWGDTAGGSSLHRDVWGRNANGRDGSVKYSRQTPSLVGHHRTNRSAGGGPSSSTRSAWSGFG